MNTSKRFRSSFTKYNDGFIRGNFYLDNYFRIAEPKLIRNDMLVSYSENDSILSSKSYWVDKDDAYVRVSFSVKESELTEYFLKEKLDIEANYYNGEVINEQLSQAYFNLGRLVDITFREITVNPITSKTEEILVTYNEEIYALIRYIVGYVLYSYLDVEIEHEDTDRVFSLPAVMFDLMNN